MVRELRKLGNTVDVIISGRSAYNAPQDDELQTEMILPGLTFISENGRINYFKTLTQQKPITFLRNIVDIDASAYDLVISDYEPISSRLARKHQIPSIGIGHQYAFQYNVPKVNSNLVSDFIMNNFAPTDVQIGLHWHHYNSPILPPILPQIQPAKYSISNKILVYLPFENLEKIKKFFALLILHEFFIYHDVPEPVDHENVHIRPFSREGFQYDLSTCNGVICNAGFELPGEALMLNKKILVKPLIGQFEQFSNAAALVWLGYGQAMNDLNINTTSYWLEHGKPKKVNFVNTAPQIAEWVNQGNWDDVNSLVDATWQHVN